MTEKTIQVITIRFLFCSLIELLSRIEIFALDWLLYGNAYREQVISYLVDYKHYHGAVNQIEINQSETKIELLLFASDWIFLPRFDFHIVMHTVTKKNFCLVYCRCFIWKSFGDEKLGRIFWEKFRAESFSSDRLQYESLQLTDTALFAFIISISIRPSIWFWKVQTRYVISDWILCLRMNLSFPLTSLW